MRFHWDRTKAADNQRKHRVSFEEACTIFSDTSILTVHDEKHSREDDRWASMGVSIGGRILVVIHSWPEPDESDEEAMRIISARRANARTGDLFGAKAMKKNYDFSKAVQGKLHRSAKALRIPIYLDEDVRRKLVGKEKRDGKSLSKIVNTILRSQIGVVEMLK